jgi:hypothetical protein
MRETFVNIGISIASNIALFTVLDVGQRIADKFLLWALPANLLAALIAALIAAAFPLALTAASRVFKLDRRAARDEQVAPIAFAPGCRNGQ